MAMADACPCVALEGLLALLLRGPQNGGGQEARLSVCEEVCTVPEVQDIAPALGSPEDFRRAVLVHVLQVRDPTPYIRDAGCERMITYIHSMVKFQQVFRTLSVHIGDRLGDEPVEASGGHALSREFAGLSVRALVERLNRNTLRDADDFCEQFRVLQGSLTEGLATLDTLFKMSEAPLSPVEVDMALGTERLMKAIEVLASPRDQVIEDAALLLDNVNRRRVAQSECVELVNKIMELQQKQLDKQSKVQQQAARAAQQQATVAALRARAANIQAAKSGQRSFAQYIDTEVQENEKALKEARDRLQRYTYWMFGPLTEIWKNDVALAERQVADFESKKKDLVEKKRQLQSGCDIRQVQLDKDEEDNCARLKEAETVAAGCDAALQDARRELDSVVCERLQFKRRLQAKLDAEGKVSVDHLLRAHQAFVNFSQRARRDVGESRTVANDWVDRLKRYVLLCSAIGKASTLKKQKQIAGELRKHVAGQGAPLLGLVREAMSLGSLVLPPEGSIPPGPRAALEDGGLATEPLRQAIPIAPLQPRAAVEDGEHPTDRHAIVID